MASYLQRRQASHGHHQIEIPLLLRRLREQDTHDALHRRRLSRCLPFMRTPCPPKYVKVIPRQIRQEYWQRNGNVILLLPPRLPLQGTGMQEQHPSTTASLAPLRLQPGRGIHAECRIVKQPARLGSISDPELQRMRAFDNRDMHASVMRLLAPSGSRLRCQGVVSAGAQPHPQAVSDP
jgi:hypothetical protein